MRKQINRICFGAGICLVVAAVLLPVLWHVGIRSAEQKMEADLNMIRKLIPQPQNAVVEERRYNSMPILSLDGRDFVGILEMPQYGLSLPVCADWGKVNRYPCRFGGSVYDRTIQIGGTSQEGQFDFYREISPGDAVCFTDMEGNRYTYAVTDIRYEKHADQTALSRKESAFTVFVKNIYGFEYIVIFCNTPD